MLNTSHPHPPILHMYTCISFNYRDNKKQTLDYYFIHLHIECVTKDHIQLFCTCILITGHRNKQNLGYHINKNKIKR